jgi:hypothetical protein
MGVTRFFKRGCIEVYRNLLDIRAQLPTDAQLEIQPSLELRAIRVWEEFSENIIRWSMSVVSAAVAAQNSALMITVNGAGNNFTADVAVPPGTVFTIDEIKNFSATTLQGTIGSATAGATSAVAPDYSDGRWGSRIARPPIRAVTYSRGGIDGDVIEGLSVAERLQRAGIFIGIAQQLAEPLNTDQTFTLYGVTVNTAVDVRVQGRVILPR